MGATKKRRRSLFIGHELFLWSVHDDDPLNTIRIVSHDKQLIMRYGWQHGLPESECFVDVIGRKFNRLPRSIPGWARVQAPAWEGPLCSPRFVRDMVLWALAPKIEVVYKALPREHDIGWPTFSSSPGELGYSYLARAESVRRVH